MVVFKSDNDNGDVGGEESTFLCVMFVLFCSVFLSLSADYQTNCPSGMLKFYSALDQQVEIASCTQVCPVCIGVVPVQIPVLENDPH